MGLSLRDVSQGFYDGTRDQIRVVTAQKKSIFIHLYHGLVEYISWPTKLTVLDLHNAKQFTSGTILYWSKIFISFIVALTSADLIGVHLSARKKASNHFNFNPLFYVLL